jgi:hypothetical protein
MLNSNSSLKLKVKYAVLLILLNAPPVRNALSAIRRVEAD